MVLMRFALILPALVLLLSACTTAPVTTTDLSSQTRPADALGKAANLRRAGNWKAALDTLRQAQRTYPDSKPINRALNKLEKAWAHNKTTLQHKLLISEAGGLVEQQALLEQIRESGNDDLATNTTLLLKDLQLDGKLVGLNSCVEYQRQHDLALARRCSELANHIEASSDSQQRYENINQAYQQALANTRRLRQQRTEEQLLDEAVTQRDQGRFLEAHLLLQEVLSSSPDNPRAHQLLKELDNTLEQQAGILASVGDRLYRDGQLEQAVAVWTSLLELRPEDAQVKARIERAQRVLNKLETLRREQAN